MRRLSLFALPMLLLWILPNACAGEKDGPAKIEKKRTSGLVAGYYRDPKFWDGNWTGVSPAPGTDAAEFTFTKWRYNRIEPLINHIFTSNRRSEKKRPKGFFSVRWRGWLYVPEAKTKDGKKLELVEITFDLHCDDGAAMKIDGEELIKREDAWHEAHGDDEESHRIKSISLKPGFHRIQVEYFEGIILKKNDKDPARLYWACPALKIPKQIIPAKYFSHDDDDLLPIAGRKDTPEDIVKRMRELLKKHGKRFEKKDDEGKGGKKDDDKD